MGLIEWSIASLLLLILAVDLASSSRPIIQLPTDKLSGSRNDLRCESWRLTVETNNVVNWTHIPAECADYVKVYVTSEQYSSDSAAVAAASLRYAAAVEVSADGKDAWVFDIDETLLSNFLPYSEEHGFGPEDFDVVALSNWAALGEDPALPASLNLYNSLQEFGFTIFLLTGRSEILRNSTEVNLKNVGYTNWKRLFMRGHSDNGTLATVYKSKKRKVIEDEGYTIRGNSGDQWSDLTGYAVAERSFKLPNPFYYIA